MNELRSTLEISQETSVVRGGGGQLFKASTKLLAFGRDSAGISCSKRLCRDSPLPAAFFIEIPWTVSTRRREGNLSNPRHGVQRLTIWIYCRLVRDRNPVPGACLFSTNNSCTVREPSTGSLNIRNGSYPELPLSAASAFPAALRNKTVARTGGTLGNFSLYFRTL